MRCFNLLFIVFLCGCYNQDCGEGGCSDNKSDESEDELTDEEWDGGIVEESDEDPYAIEDEEQSEYLWTLREIEAEQYECQDELWNTAGDPERFCKCRTEMLSVRWTYDDYRHHPFSYIERLNRNDSINRCLEPDGLFEDEDSLIIEEDAEWIPEQIEGESIDENQN